MDIREVGGFKASNFKEVTMLKFIEGYKTYLSVMVIILHQILKVAGIDVADESLSITIDVLFAVLAGIARKVAKPTVL